MTFLNAKDLPRLKQGMPMKIRLAGYKKPLQVTFVDALPKSSTGKRLRRALRDAAPGAS